MDYKKVAKVAKEYYCEYCNYKCFNKTNFDKHLTTEKHKKMEITKNKITLDYKKVENKEFLCICGKSYKYRQGLSKHKRKCSYIKSEEIIDENTNSKQLDLKTMFLEIVNENRELRNMLIEQQKQLSNQQKTNTDENRELRSMMVEQQKQITELIPKIGNTTNNNQKFNINVFLNEKCRDAINMTDFIKSIKITIEQLDSIRETGLARGLSKALMTNLNRLSIYERPIHCTDIKRETLYIKHDNWECDRDKTLIKTAIKQMSGKPYACLQEWITKNPDFKEVDEKQDYVANVLSIIGKSTHTNNIDNKIIKNLCVETYIN